MIARVRTRVWAVILVVLGWGTQVHALTVDCPTVPVHASTPDYPTVPTVSDIPAIWWIGLAGAIVALIFARRFFCQVRAADPGDEKMQSIARAVARGAMAYLRRQYKIVAIYFVIVSILLFLMGWVFGVQHKIVFIAFLTGGFYSALCGWLGMKTATMASNRTTQGVKHSLDRGLNIAFRAGAVMGLSVVGFVLLDTCFWFLTLTHFSQMTLMEITIVMLSCGMGASSQALFARVGGGIFTKAADVGADLVGKVEAGIPEDDPRNPATIADNVGDNVGDVAGMGADLYESYYGSILATAALGVAAAMTLPNGNKMQVGLQMLSLPMALAGVGVFLSIAGIFLVHTKEGASVRQLMGSLMRGVVGSSVLILIAAIFLCRHLLSDIQGLHWWGVWLSICAGMIAGIVIGKSTEYFTSYDHKPTREIADTAETGAGTVLIAGLAVGMRSTWVALLTVIVAILCAYGFAGGMGNAAIGLYGVGLAAVSMLSTLAITLATDAYGPIADNAGGNAEMTGQDPSVREKTDALDALGNTTAAMGKGFAIGSAALTALALLAAYVEQVKIEIHRQGETAIEETYGDSATCGNAVYLGGGKVVWKERDVNVPGNGPLRIGLMLSQGQGIKRLGGYTPGEVEGIRGSVWGGEWVDGKATISFNDKQGTVDSVSAGLFDEPGGDADIVLVEKATLDDFVDFYEINLMNPKVLCGMFAGVLLVFLFSSLTMSAVGRAAMAMVREVRRQFRDIPGILEGTGKPDYERCVEISTIGAQKEMIVPSLLAIIVPIAVGLVLDVAGVMGLLAGGLACGFAMAIFMANAGGAWDNAKKYIETGAHGGKGSDAHKAAIVGDTVGDPFKDTSGPSLNILIKLMSMVSIVFAGLVIKYSPQIQSWIGLD